MCVASMPSSAGRPGATASTAGPAGPCAAAAGGPGPAPPPLPTASTPSAARLGNIWTAAASWGWTTAGGGGAVGLAPQPQGAAGGSAPPISPFPRLQRVGLPSVIGWPWKSQPRKPLEAGECSLLLLVPRASRPLPSRKEIPSPLILCGSAIRALSLSGLVSIHPGRGDRSWPRSVAPAPPHSHGLTALSRTPGSQCVGLCSWKTKGQDSSQAKKQAGQDTPAEPASPRPPFLRNGGVAA